jgi:hypothetical protein
VGEADEVMLTDREREALAGLAQAIGDPWLARQLAGGAEPPPPRRRMAWLTRLPGKVGTATAGWIGLLLVAAGAALAVTTFVFSTAVASAGLVLMGVGLWQFADHLGGGVIRRLNARRPPAAVPSPPRKPPAAA